MYQHRLSKFYNGTPILQVWGQLAHVHESSKFDDEGKSIRFRTVRFIVNSGRTGKHTIIILDLIYS